MTRVRSPPRNDVPPVRPDGLQLRENKPLQHRLWTVQRAGWVAAALLVALALLGLTGGGGPLQTATWRAGPLTIVAPRVTRRDAPEEIRITSSAAGPASIALDAAFIEAFEITEIQPQPDEIRNSGGTTTLFFSGFGAPPQDISLRLRPRHVGLARIGIGSAMVTTLVLP